MVFSHSQTRDAVGWFFLSSIIACIWNEHLNMWSKRRLFIQFSWNSQSSVKGGIREGSWKFLDAQTKSNMNRKSANGLLGLHSTFAPRSWPRRWPWVHQRDNSCSQLCSESRDPPTAECMNAWNRRKQSLCTTLIGTKAKFVALLIYPTISLLYAHYSEFSMIPVLELFFLISQQFERGWWS